MGTLKPHSNGVLYSSTVNWYSAPINGQCTNFILFDVAL